MANQTVQPKSSGSTAVPVTAPAFRAQTQPTIKRPGVNINAAGTTVATLPFGQGLPDTQIPPTTLLRCIYLEVALTVASGNAATVAFNADAPLNVFSTVNFHDSQGTSIVGPFDSFTLAMAQKYFGFTTNADVTTSEVYGLTTGAVATGGSFNMVFRIPVEVVSRTGIGSQINTDTQSPLVLSLTVNTEAAIYATAPTAASVASLSVVVSYGGYWNQSGNPSSFPVPTAVGSLNYLNWTTYQNLNGSSQFQLSNIGLGNSILNLMFINRTTAGARSDAAFGNPVQLTYRGNVLWQYSQLLWKHVMSEAYGYTGTTSTTGGASSYLEDTGLGTVAQSPTPSLNQGVYNTWFNQDFVNEPGATLFYGLLNTAVGDSLELTTTFGAASTLIEVINFIAVSGAVNAIQGH